MPLIHHSKKPQPLKDPFFVCTNIFLKKNYCKNRFNQHKILTWNQHGTEKRVSFQKAEQLISNNRIVLNNKEPFPKKTLFFISAQAGFFFPSAVSFKSTTLHKSQKTTFVNLQHKKVTKENFVMMFKKMFVIVVKLMFSCWAACNV